MGLGIDLRFGFFLECGSSEATRNVTQNPHLAVYCMSAPNVSQERGSVRGSGGPGTLATQTQATRCTKLSIPIRYNTTSKAQAPRRMLYVAQIAIPRVLVLGTPPPLFVVSTPES